MNKKYQKHILTKKQMKDFKRDGYILVKNVLSSKEIKNILCVIDKIWEKHHSNNSDDYLHMFDFFNKDKIFIKLFDNKKILPLILGLLGWNIYVFHSHLDINIPINRDNPPKLAWHRDNSRMNYDFRNGKYPLIAIKAGYWLSDVSKGGRGNLYVVPGSHRGDIIMGKNIRNDKLPRGVVPIKAKSGDVVLFDSRIWHTRSNNFSEFTRKVIFIGYAYRWLRPRDDAKILPNLLKNANNNQKQLLNRNIGSDAYVPEENISLKKLYLRLYGKK